MAATILLLLGAVYAISTVAVFGAFFAALQEEKMAGSADSQSGGENPGAAPEQAAPDQQVEPSPPARFVHRMEREAISQPPVPFMKNEPENDAWVAGLVLGRVTLYRDEFEDARPR